ncbi:MAG TPA: tyrosine-protein phosphatase [Streptosporangiaceae bacterium]|jgi:protein-tyrosine phosphatase
MSLLSPRHVEFDRLHNFRDFGGYATADGRRVLSGRLYRSDSLGKLAGEDVTRFAALGVRTVIDLRYSSEIEAGGRVPDRDGLAYHHLSIEHRPYDQAQLTGAVEPVRFLADRYAEVAADGAAELAAALRIIAADSAPLVLHCASGKDRTGLVAALVLSLLGVEAGNVVADYALSGLATERLVADWQTWHTGRPLIWPHYGTAPAGVMEVFLAELAGRYGSVRDYVTRYLGVPDLVIAELQDRYLAD